ncbi:MAG TPA: hypothetical protein VF498_00865, partial [Anaerolineales bacterium]
MNNILALVITLALSLIWLRLNDYAAQRGWVSSQQRQDLVTVGSAVDTVFVLHDDDITVLEQ